MHGSSACVHVVCVVYPDTFIIPVRAEVRVCICDCYCFITLYVLGK